MICMFYVGKKVSRANFKGRDSNRLRFMKYYMKSVGGNTLCKQASVSVIVIRGLDLEVDSGLFPEC